MLPGLQEPEFSQYFPPHLDPRNRAIHELNRSWLKILVLCREHPKRDHILKFVPLGETTTIPVCFIWESPPPGPAICNLQKIPTESKRFETMNAPDFRPRAFFCFSMSGYSDETLALVCKSCKCFYSDLMRVGAHGGLDLALGLA